MNAGDDVGTVAPEELPKWRLLPPVLCLFVAKLGTCILSFGGIGDDDSLNLNVD